MKYAIIQIQGKQYLIHEGDSLDVDRLETEGKDSLVISDVLLTKNGEEVKVGQPLVAGASVTLKVIKELKGEKIRVFKYKSKSRYRKTRGHRQALTRVSVESISIK
jgi:large subunit ribosomal protein L21